MSQQSREEIYGEWIEALVDRFLKEEGREPSLEEIEEIIENGDWRRGGE